MRESPTLGTQVLRFISEHHLVSGGQKLVVAVSGGADSVCLLYILVSLRSALDIKLHVAHLNHGLRGADSNADARYVAALCRRLNIPATIEKRDVKSYRKQHRLSLEEAAREVRYAFLDEVSRSVGAGMVAVGHTADDHVETILMHLIRGSGTRGLVGLRPFSLIKVPGGNLNVIRPILMLSRAETEGCCRSHRLKPRVDVTNLSLPPLRNRIRRQLLPLLRKYNPQVGEALIRMAGITGDDLDFLEKQAVDLKEKIAEKQGNIFTFNRQLLADVPLALRRYLLRSCLGELLGDTRDIEARHIEEIIQLMDKPAGKKISLPGGLTFAVEYDSYALGFDSAPSPFPVLQEEIVLTVPGRTRMSGWDIAAEIIDNDKSERFYSGADGFTAYFDFDKAGDRLTMCRRQPGDRFQPLGMGQPKKLNVFMIDARIPRIWRSEIPLVCSPERILWVVGYRIDERAKVGKNTRRVLRLKFNRL